MTVKQSVSRNIRREWYPICLSWHPWFRCFLVILREISKLAKEYWTFNPIPSECWFYKFCLFFHILFFNKFIYFIWRLITLQYCSGFAIHWHESSTGVHVFPILNPPPPPSPAHPSGSSQCTSPEHPVSCVKPGLEIHFTYENIYVSMHFCQVIPPSPSPTESKKLFYTSVSLLLSRI